ncbi:MAG: AI-2E family transporter [Lachnospira sp.]|nr:AI-2E family transporter [Lachnospira sp.]
MKWYKKPDMRWSSIVSAGCAIALFYAFITHINLFGRGIAGLWNICLPVILGLIIAYIFNPLIKFFQRTLFGKMRRRHLARILSVALSMSLFILLIALLLFYLVPQLIDSIVSFVHNLNGYVDGLQNILNSIAGSASSSGLDISQMVSTGNSLLDKIVSLVPSNFDDLIRTSTQIGSNLLMWVVAFIMSIYFLVDKESLQSGFRRLLRLLLPEKSYAGMSAFWGRCNAILIRYIICELLDALFVGAANFIFMAIARMPYAVLISVVVGVTNLAPTFGPIVGAIIGAFILLLVNPWHVVSFLIFTIILQTFDGYVVKPKFYGQALQIPSILVLASIIIFGRMFGVIGILLAIPIAAIISYLYGEGFIPWLIRRHEKKEEKNPQPAGRKAPASASDTDLPREDR